MKKVNYKAIMLALCVSFMGYNVYCGMQSVKHLDLTLSSVEALANDTESQWGCAGNPTWLPNHALLSANCWNGGSHKECKEMSGVCCNPSEQTDCPGVKIDIF